MRWHKGMLSPTLLFYGAAVIAGGFMLWQVYNIISTAGYNKAKLECLRAAQQQADADIAQAGAASLGLETADGKAKVVYRTITETVDRYIDRPVYRNACLDADGLRDANAALSGKTAPTGESDKPVPGPDPIEGRDWSRGLAEAHRNFRDVLRMQEEASRLNESR